MRSPGRRRSAGRRRTRRHRPVLRARRATGRVASCRLRVAQQAAVRRCSTAGWLSCGRQSPQTSAMPLRARCSRARSPARHAGQHVTVEADGSDVGRLDAGGDAQQRGLSGAAGSPHAQEVTGVDLQRHVLQCGNVPAAVGKRLAHALEGAQAHQARAAPPRTPRSTGAPA